MRARHSAIRNAIRISLSRVCLLRLETANPWNLRESVTGLISVGSARDIKESIRLFLRVKRRERNGTSLRLIISINQLEDYYSSNTIQQGLGWDSVFLPFESPLTAP